MSTSEERVQAKADRVAGRIFDECLHHDEDGNLWMDRMKAVTILKQELAAANRDGYCERCGKKFPHSRLTEAEKR